jgi:hypothetical protein
LLNYNNLKLTFPNSEVLNRIHAIILKLNLNDDIDEWKSMLTTNYGKDAITYSTTIQSDAGGVESIAACLTNISSDFSDLRKFTLDQNNHINTKFDKLNNHVNTKFDKLESKLETKLDFLTESLCKFMEG